MNDEAIGKPPVPAQETGSSGARPEKPPRRRPIGGISSVYSRSNLRFPSAPDQKFECEATFVFPGRARWRIARKAAEQPDSPDGAEPAEDYRGRSIRFQFGKSLWLLNYGQVDSQPLVGDAEVELLIQLELRRVAMIWPAELEWKIDGQTQTANLGKLGSLRAELDPDSGQPSSIESLNPDGTPRESLEKITWTREPEGERSWPSSWDLVVKKQVIWNETFTEVKSGLKVLETSFIPSDRRGSGGSTSSAQGLAIQQLSLGRAAFWREELDPAVRRDWDLSLRASRDALAEWKKSLTPLGLTLEPRAYFLLDEEGLPLTLQLQLTAIPETLPAGWKELEERSALRLVSNGIDWIGTSSLARLRAGVPDKHIAKDPLAIVQLTARGAGITQLILPIASSE